MIVEALIVGASIVGCAGLWVAAVRHRLNIDFQKEKLKHDLEVLRPPEPRIPTPPKKEPTPNQQALTALLERRSELEENITKLRTQACQFNQYDDKKYALWRADTLKALEDARKEQQELVEEQEKLLKLMQGDEDERLDAAEEPIQPVARGPVAKRVADLGELHDAELHEQEASREGAA